jgi:Protein of unknown function (DUF3833)
MKALLRLAAIALPIAALTAACATRPPIPTAAAASAAFVVEQHLVGASVARGEFRSITGVRRGFTAQLNGAWDGRTLTLVEDFAFDDGQRDRKTWRLERTEPGRYVGTREDVVGQAQGFQDGAVFRLEYDVILPSSNGHGRKVRFRDVMAFNGDGDVLNNATVGWWGLRVGSVSLLIQRSPRADGP